ncbi:hypothetical protein C8J57DRAFT_1725062 [Mycena rebaudengoi]|nr:hypothetical protein C8J57DRAFT_1725062 [Mycena rebaudengoi]
MTCLFAPVAACGLIQQRLPMNVIVTSSRPLTALLLDGCSLQFRFSGADWMAYTAEIPTQVAHQHRAPRNLMKTIHRARARVAGKGAPLNIVAAIPTQVAHQDRTPRNLMPEPGSRSKGHLSTSWRQFLVESIKEPWKPVETLA